MTVDVERAAAADDRRWLRVGERRLSHVALLVLLLAALAVLYLGSIAGHPLQDPDEGRYAEIPREMIESGDWLTPRLNYVDYFEKPPLLYWLVAVSFRAFGLGEGAARLVPALAALATLMATFLLGRRMFGRDAAALATAMLATTPLFFVFSQSLVIDMLLTLLVTACLGAAWLVVRDPSEASWPLVVAATAALAVLAKGLVGLVLPGMVVVVVAVLERDGRALRALLRPAPILVFLVLAVPWFVLMSLRHPTFLYEFFVLEHLARFATDHVGHPEPAWFYLPVLAGGALPWTLLAAGLLGSRAMRPGRDATHGREVRFLAVWTVIVIGFFSAARSKLPGYVLPALPPAALLLGRVIDRIGSERPHQAAAAARVTLVFLAVLGATLLLAGLAPSSVVEAVLEDDVRHSAVDLARIQSLLSCSGLIALVGTAFLLRSAAGGRSLARRTLEVAVLLVLLVSPLLAGRDLVKSSNAIAEAIRLAARPNDVVAEYRTLMQGLSFYLGRRIVQIGDAGENGRGAARAADREQFFWADARRLETEWASGRRLFVATNRKHVPELMQLLVPTPRIVAENGKRVVLSNG